MSAGRIFSPGQFDYVDPLPSRLGPIAPVRRIHPIPAAICRNPIRWRRVLNPASTAAGALPAFLRSFDLPEPGELRRVARVYVWGRWFVLSIATFAWLYPLNVDEVVYGPNVALAMLLLATNGFLHYRLATERTVSWRWMLALSALDLAMLSGGVAAHRGFESPFFVGYYPSLAMFAVAFGSVRLTLVWVTMAAAVYAALCLAVEPGLDVSANDEEILLIRVAGMYTVVVVVNLISRVERIRRMEAVERERALQRERIELSHAIHNTMAQSAYMIGMGIERAKELADRSNEELMSTLEETSALSRSAMWEMRHPMEIGEIFEGMELGGVLESLVATFSTISSIPADLVQSGVEPPLPIATRGALFSIAFNALTNALRHSHAGHVRVGLDFERDGLRMSVADDGTGLPDDYATRGQGFRNMREDAERMGGRFVVETSGSEWRTTVTCVLPYRHMRGGS